MDDPLAAAVVLSLVVLLPNLPLARSHPLAGLPLLLLGAAAAALVVAVVVFVGLFLLLLLLLLPPRLHVELLLP